MFAVLNFIQQVLSTPAIFVGLLALLGLLLQKEKPQKCVTGTIKTILGFIVLNADLYDAPVSAEDGMIEEDFEDGEVIEYDDGSLEDDEMSFYDADEEDYAEGFIDDEEEYWEETEF